MIKLKLLDNIQFIYELALARLELQSFIDNFKITNDFREFKIEKELNNLQDITKRTAYFKTINGDYSDYCHLQQHNQTRSVNQFLTHWIYPYKGKFHPQMIRALINIIKLKKSDTLLDPFAGSGTAIVEGQLLGVNSMGIDISPLCVLISKVKTESIYVLDKIKEYKDFYIKNLNLFSQNKSLKESTDEKVRNFYKIAEMVARSDNSRRRKNFTDSFIKNTDKMIASVEDYRRAIKGLDLKLGKTRVVQGDARNTRLKAETVDGIITSPPYSIALNYVANDSHALTALGYDLNKIKEDFIGVRGSGINKFKLYDEDMEKAYIEMYRVLKKGKYCVIIIGNVTYQGQEIDTTQNVINFCEKLGFTTIKKLAKIIYGLYNVMQREYILILKK